MTHTKVLFSLYQFAVQTLFVYLYICILTFENKKSLDFQLDIYTLVHQFVSSVRRIRRILSEQRNVIPVYSSTEAYLCGHVSRNQTSKIMFGYENGSTSIHTSVKFCHSK